MVEIANTERRTPDRAPAKKGRRGRPPLDPIARRNRIIVSATELFIENGYAETTVEAVGKAAGVTKRTIYELVGDKTELFHQVCDYCHHNIAEIRLDLPVSGESLRSNLAELANVLIDNALAEETLKVERLVIFEQSNFPELVSKVNQANRLNLNRKIAVVFEKLSKLGMIGCVDSFQAAEIFFDLVVGNLGFRKILGFNEPNPSPDETSERIDTFIDGYLRRHGLPPT